MKVAEFTIRNFRRLEDVNIDIDGKETIFVGPNNSGKTSATAAFRSFLGGRDFRIHDYSVSQISIFNKFGESGENGELPRIELDIWFDIDPTSIAFGRAFSLLPRLAEGFNRLGVRLSYGVSDAVALLANYRAAYPEKEGKHAKTIAQYLSIDANLKRHSEMTFFSLEKVTVGKDSEVNIIPSPLAADEGNRLLATLVRVDFVDAQRNIDDDDSSRSNRLSAAFAAFYRRNLEQATIAEAAHRILDAQKKGDSRKSIDLLRHSSPSFAIDGPNAEKTLSEMIGRSREVLTELSRIWSSGSMRDVFNYCRDAGLIKLPDRLLAHLKRQPRAEAYDEDQHAPEKEDWLVDAYLAMSPTEVGLYSAFIQDNTAYSTQHGVKGEEYKDVLVVYDDIEAAWTHYNFTKILTPATAGNPTEGQLDRGRKLAYVCFSRSTENLRVMLFTPNPKAAAQELINRGLIKEDQVRIQ